MDLGSWGAWRSFAHPYAALEQTQDEGYNRLVQKCISKEILPIFNFISFACCLLEKVVP